MERKNQLVVPNLNGGWSVRKAGASRVTKHYSTQEEAINAAKKIADKNDGVVFVFGTDARIEKRISK